MINPEPKATVTVALGDRSYPIHIGAGVLRQPELIRSAIRGSQALIISNETIAPLYLEPVLAGLEDLKCSRVLLPDGEQYKTLDSLQPIYDRLLGDAHNRTTTVIALGGGVVGDIAGFVAATYQRGVAFIQIPTTLLAQVDSSVGGKTAVNHPLGKNMIGAFHQPRCVLADTDTLQTLPDREYAAGLAEVVKYGLIADPQFYQWLQQNIEGLQRRDQMTLVAAIRRSCENKAQIVAEDEREAGRRALLNLGHTFGHAIETEAGYGEWLHGEAVAIGMVLAAQLSARLGHIEESDVAQLSAFLAKCGLPVKVPAEMTVEAFLRHMAVDKKVLDGQLRLVLLRAIGEAYVSDSFDPSLLRDVLTDACTS